ncbi:branched-chain amino acid transaminase [Amycolatopsis sp., V23-08]|uniref:Branched-chain-amino-acid aminotransferase n=1 Tax=Amycolatopsis heterodermiae TaxID=3110235 RepID=A0ABU5R296_9PSEU|nr:branched-chain amino acid transaminase [Amycolatopsis sp., V23-08]MEA5360327.1 branched-chain amino acid transaminase [Amycolatopsis sp., V23-08]
MSTGTPVATRLAFYQGQFVENSAVRLPLTTQALHYGTGVFEGIRAYADPEGGPLAVFRLREHVERLLRSARTLRIELPHDAGELTGIVLDLLDRNGCVGDTYIRPVAYKYALAPGTPFGVRLSGVSSQFSVTTVAMGSYVPQTGLHCKISSYRRVPSASIPSGAKITGAYANNALAVEEAQADGCDDALMLDGDGHLTEASTSNVFVVGRDGRVATPPATGDLLPGITRASVIELLERETGVVVEERPVTVAELAEAGEVFVSGTGVEICPVTAVDHRPVGTGRPGDLTTEVRRLYTEVVRGRRPAYASWLTPVRSA